ncbi:collagen-binding domain-containing protein [Companilactobacillus sp. HBUAS59544]|uniref:collagen-binding domain-containing protein n=1 Tax=Companilactobacillus sp. HBUAS59544 TaxID=3109363 RepID=UPI002FF16F24
MLMKKGKKWALSCVAISAVVLTGMSANNVKADEVSNSTDSAATTQSTATNQSSGNQNSTGSNVDSNGNEQSQDAIQNSNASVNPDVKSNIRVQNTNSRSVNPEVQDGKNVSDDFSDVSNNTLGYASKFHIFANEATLEAHTNGNVAVKNLYGNVNFGTNITEEKLLDKDISYVQNVHNMASSSFVSANDNRENKVIFGVNNTIELSNSDTGKDAPYVNGTKIGNLQNQEIFQDKGTNTYINFEEEFAKLENTSENLSELKSSTITNADFPDMNNRVINLKKFEVNDNNQIVINLDPEVLNSNTPLKIAGISSGDGGTSIIINVDTKGQNSYGMNSQIKLEMSNPGEDPVERPNQETEYFDDNHLLWNFYDSTTTDRQYTGTIEMNNTFQGSVLAPEATVIIHHNLDGNIVADKVIVQGGETHRWDLQDNNKIPTDYEIPSILPGQVTVTPPDFPDGVTDPEEPDENTDGGNEGNEGTDPEEPDENNNNGNEGNEGTDPGEPDENNNNGNEGNEGTNPEEPDENNNNGNEGNEGTDPEEPDENTDNGNEGNTEEPDTDKDDEDEDSESEEETGSENEDNDSEETDSEENNGGNIITNGGSEGNSEDSNDSSELGEGVLPDVVGSDKNESQTPANDTSDNAAKLPQTGATSGILATISGILLIVLGFLLKGIKPRKD